MIVKPSILKKPVFPAVKPVSAPVSTESKPVVTPATPVQEAPKPVSPAPVTPAVTPVANPATPAKTLVTAPRFVKPGIARPTIPVKPVTPHTSQPQAQAQVKTTQAQKPVYRPVSEDDDDRVPW